MSTTLQEQLAADVASAFPDLVDRYGSMVVTLASRLTDPTTGEDLAQEAFLRAYRALIAYDERRVAALELRPWLATIVRNLVRNEYRRRSRRPTVSPDEGGDAVAPEAPDLSEQADQIGRLLAHLPDAQRDAVVLRHIIDLPINEVALTMGCPVGTAKSHVSRGLASLRAVLDETPSFVGSEEHA